MSDNKPLFCKLFGHKYQARYSYGSPTIKSVKAAFAEDALPIINATKSSTYVHDICVRCGDIIKCR